MTRNCYLLVTVISQSGSSHPPLVWIDMEMSGLDPEQCRILEIATVITDSKLEVLAQSPSMIVHQADEVLDAMDQWCTEHHGKSGLTQAVKDSTLSEEEAMQRTLDLIQAHCPKGGSPLCGNSVGQDRKFIARWMKPIDAYLHYRIVDVSSIKELARRWYPELPPFEKKERHRALDDILESIAELRYYQERLFVAP